MLDPEVLMPALGAAIVVPLAYYLLRRAAYRLPAVSRAANPFVQVLGIEDRQSIAIVVPFRTDLESPLGGAPRLQVTYEDMIAANYAERIVMRAGVPDEGIEIVSAAEFMENEDYHARDVILICSPKTNPATKRFFATIKDLGIEFAPGDGDLAHRTQEEWKIRIGGIRGDTYESPSYEEVGPVVPMTGADEVHDRAIIVRAASPWNPERKALAISGIRGIGTWGAARFLRTYASDFASDALGRDFFRIVPVTYQNLRILNDSRASEYRTHLLGGRASWYWRLAKYLNRPRYDNQHREA